MSGPASPRCCLARLAIAAVLAGFGAGSSSRAQTDASLPDGIVAGPFVLAPTFTTTYGLDTNLFRQPGDADESTSDQAVEIGAGLGLYLPFRMSMFEIEVEGARVQFAQNEFDRNIRSDYQIGLELNFKSGDQLTLRDTYVRDFLNVREFDEGGGSTFQGQPFDRNSWEIALRRSEAGRQGYGIRVRRADLIFKGDREQVSFFEYRGFSTGFQYFHPLPSYRNFVVYYGARRFNNYDPGDPVGVPFRKEVSDTVQVGFSGATSLGPYNFRVGWGKFRYDNQRPRARDDPATWTPSTPWEGISGQFQFDWMPSPRSTWEFLLLRRPLPSGFNTYYINNGLRSEFERDWLQDVSFSAALVLDWNTYGDPTPPCNTFRKELRWELGGGLGWELHPRAGFEIDVVHDRRRSNCEEVNFDATVLTATFNIGWF